MTPMRFRTTGLLIVAAAIQLFTGLTMYAFPRSFEASTFEWVRPHLAFLSAGLMASGTILLLLARYRLTPWAGRLLATLSATPMILLALSATQADMVGVSVIWYTLATAVLITPWLPVGPSGRLRLGMLTLATTELILGLLMLLMPQAFPSPMFRPLHPWVPLVGAMGLAGALCLPFLAVQGKGIRQILLALVGLVFPSALVWSALQVGHWHAALTWGVWLVTLFGVLWNALTPSLTGEHAEQSVPAPDSPVQVERMLELWSWLLVLVVLAIAMIGQTESVVDPTTIRIFAAAISGYNALMHFLLPHVGRTDRRVLAHLTFLSLAFGFLLTDPGHWAFVLAAMMVIPPFLATRVRGEIVGYWMLGGMVVSVVLFASIHAWRVNHDLSYAISEIAVQVLVIVAAGILGIRSAAQQRRLVQELSRARTDLQRQVEQQALIAHIGQAIRRSLNLQETLTTTVNELGKAMQVNRCYIRLSSPNGFHSTLHQYVTPGTPPVGEEHLPYLVLGPAVARARDVIVADDVLKFPDWRDVALKSGLRAALAAPILADDRFLGAIVLHQCSGPRAWTPDEIQFLKAVAGQVGVALAHAGAHRDLEDRHTELQQVNATLSAQAEELEAQREELQAQNEELIHQSDLLTTQARQLEKALLAARSAEEAQARLSAILEATTDYVGLTNRQGEVLYLNAAARDVFGANTIGTVQLTIQQVFPAWFVRVIVRQAMHTAIREGHWIGEGSVLNASGQEVPVSLVILAHRNETGSIDFFATIARDISSQKAAEAALRESEDRFRGAFDYAPTGMGLVGADGRWTQVNPPLCEMLGYTESQFLGTTLKSMIHPEDREAAVAYTQQMIQGQIPSCQVEQRWLHQAGHVVWSQVSASIVHTREHEHYFIVHVEDISERKRVESQLLHLANYDSLTSLFNRRRFQEELERHLANAIRYRTQGALLFLDLDQFKYINDSLGHQAGDQMLRSLASLMRQMLREGDSIARLGGDEFAILLPHADAVQAEAVANKILDALRRHVEVIDGRPIGITGSMGLALFPDHGRTAEELLAFADMAMYKVKDLGRNTYALYSPDEATREQLESKLTWERRIRDALENDGFVLYQQPILNLRRGSIRRYEALLRMKGPHGEVIMPGHFLPVAERFGLIHAIDRWVVREAIHQIARQHKTTPDYCLEVNLSAKAFADPELLPLIKREIEATGINPAFLVLEITETVAGADSMAGRSWIHSVRELGCEFALDDFGSGFSSFSYLKNLPVDYLKIDGSFIRNLAESPMDQELVRAMVQVARGLGRRTIAECVENSDTLMLLRDLGVDYAQGYHIGRPTPMIG